VALSPADIEAAIAALLARRAPGRTICPSEAARALDADGWRARMDAVRAVAFAMADRGELEVTQRGEVVDGRAARGPIRLRRPGT
jgi:hypothetical protein